MTPPPPPAPAPAAFQITDAASLEWYVDKLTGIEEKKARIKRQAEAMVADLERDAQSLRFGFEAQAQTVTRRLLERSHRKTRHVKFLTGSIGFRTVPARLTITNNAKVLAWVRTHAPDILEDRVNVRALTARFKAAPDGITDSSDGVRVEIPGLHVLPEREAFNVRAINLT